MVVTGDQELYERMKLLCLHGISKDAWKRYTAEGSWFYEVIAPGYKYNMADLAASLGLHQLARRQWLLERRRAIARRYTEAFSTVPEVDPPAEPRHVDHAWHLYMLRLRLEQMCITRDEVVQLLSAANIGTSVHFIPLHLHPYYRNAYGLQPTDFPRALDAFRREISLPIYPGLSDDDVNDVIAAVRTIIAAHRRRPQERAREPSL